MRGILLVFTVLVAACSGVSYNPTVFPYQVDQAKLAAKPVKTVVIASVNSDGRPTPSVLRKPEPKVKALIKRYLAANGYNVAPPHIFENAFQKSQHAFGDYYDPTSGKVDRENWMRVIGSTLHSLRRYPKIDAIIFTDLIQHDVQHSAGMQHYARWWGVTRKPATQGTGAGVPTDFPWTQKIKGASLVVTMYNMDGEPLFTSRGGIDTLHAIDLRRANKGFVRRKKILSSESNIQEGIRLAFHPLIEMKSYPGKK